MLRLGEHRASHATMIGFPIGNEIIAALMRSGEEITMTVCTDPVRMGTDSNLREWLAEELAAWGIHDVLM
jgi:hypothetical protein